MSQIRIPSGTRDLIGQQVMNKRYLQNKIHSVFDSYGYEEVMTPALEYYQTYNMAFAALKDTEMYKFFDEHGEILGLRADMTVPIARLAAARFKDASRPLRFQYASNVYKVREALAGNRSEVMDCGIELIGARGNMELEVLEIAFECLKELGFETYTLEIGNAKVFQAAAAAIEADEETIARLGDLIERKSMVELEEYLMQLQLDEAAAIFFLNLPMLAGDEKALIQAYDLAFTPQLKEIIVEMLELHRQLVQAGYAGQVSYDLGKVPHLNYYTGLIFEAFVLGSGRSILSGGRYDHLLEKFGPAQAACGFSIKLDYLLDLMEPAPRPRRKIVLYVPENPVIFSRRQFSEAARKLRQNNYAVILADQEEA